MTSNVKCWLWRRTSRVRSWSLRKRAALQIWRLDTGMIRAQCFVETGFLDALDPDGHGTHFNRDENVLYHLGRLHVRVSRRQFERLANLLEEQQEDGQRSGRVQTVAEAEYPLPVVILQALHNGPQRAWVRPDEPR